MSRMVKGDREHGMEPESVAAEEWPLPRGMSCPIITAAFETVYYLFNILKDHLLKIEEVRGNTDCESFLQDLKIPKASGGNSGMHVHFQQPGTSTL